MTSWICTHARTVKTCLNASKALHLKLESTSLASGAARLVAGKITHRTHWVGGLEDPRTGSGVVVKMKFSPSAENRSLVDQSVVSHVSVCCCMQEYIDK